MTQSATTTTRDATLYTLGKIRTCQRLLRDYRTEALTLSLACLCAGRIPGDDPEIRTLAAQIAELEQAARDWSADLRKAK